jgi:signal transduction histidine kinase
MISADELAAFDLFKDDTREALEWLAKRFVVRCYEEGEVTVRSGDPADEFLVVLEGEIHFMRDNELYGGAYEVGPGEVAGVLPFSRMTVYRGRGWAAKPSRAAFMHVSHLRDLVYQAPCLAQKLVNEMIDRARDMTQRDERANKMLALGKLSAGLAHELNNPASAVVRSAARLREVLDDRRRNAVSLRADPLPPEAARLIIELGDAIPELANNPSELDALERADREADLTDWLEARGYPTHVASALTDAGITPEKLMPLANQVSEKSATHGLQILAADQEIFSLSREIEEAASRIADLVQTVKKYSYMDRVPITDVDIEQGLDVTLRMFQHQLKHGFEVRREFAGNLPKIRANGSEVNQIWTNLIDNAIDAMCEAEVKVLRVKTAMEPENVVVEIADSGPGIPEDVQPKIFDPFFTTKEVGKGTGLGLDIVNRIVRHHHGSIQLNSVPGNTVFRVRLPLTRAE